MVASFHIAGAPITLKFLPGAYALSGLVPAILDTPPETPVTFKVVDRAEFAPTPSPTARLLKQAIARHPKADSLVKPRFQEFRLTPVKIAYFDNFSARAMRIGVATFYRLNGEECATVEDAQQESLIGLAKALTTHNPQKGEIESYAYQRIVWSVKAFVQKARGTRAGEKPRKRLENAIQKLRAKSASKAEPALQDLAKALGVTMEELHTKYLALRFPVRYQSLEEILFDAENGSALPRQFAVEPNLEEQLQRQGEIYSLKRALRQLLQREKKVLRLHLQGLNNTEISQIVGVDNSTVGRDLKRAKNKVAVILTGKELAPEEDTTI